jgi:hypothetical protein
VDWIRNLTGRPTRQHLYWWDLFSSGCSPHVSSEVPNLAQPQTVVILIDELAMSSDGLSTATSASARHVWLAISLDVARSR